MAIDARSTNGAATPALELIRSVADRKERPVPWVDADTLPWRDEQFSERYVRRANYQDLYGMKDTGEETDDIAALLNRGAKARVLDLCAGNGRHAVAMALRGYRVTGIDIGPGAVSLARETAKNLGLSVDFRLLDVKNISFEDAFDAAYLTCGGFSDFSPADGAAILSLLERAIAPGGKLVVEFASKDDAPRADDRTWRYVQAERSLYTDGPHLQLDERTYDEETGASTLRTFVVSSNGAVSEFSRCTQYYDDNQMRELLRAAHLETVGITSGSAPGLKKISAKKA
jgi:SAM-dependent methyltransferase